MVRKFDSPSRRKSGNSNLQLSVGPIGKSHFGMSLFLLFKRYRSIVLPKGSFIPGFRMANQRASRLRHSLIICIPGTSHMNEWMLACCLLVRLHLLPIAFSSVLSHIDRKITQIPFHYPQRCMPAPTLQLGGINY